MDSSRLHKLNPLPHFPSDVDQHRGRTLEPCAIYESAALGIELLMFGFTFGLTLSLKFTLTISNYLPPPVNPQFALIICPLAGADVNLYFDCTLYDAFGHFYFLFASEGG